MNARPLLLLLLVACSPSPPAPPAPSRAPELVVEGRVENISISPAGHLWFGTPMGHAYRSDDGGRSWAEADVTRRRRDLDPQMTHEDSLDQVAFFDAQRGMFSGYIGEDKDRVLLTGDGGKTWNAARLPVETFWAYDAQATSDGRAWLAGSDGQVLRSDDFGRTWRSLARPFEQDERTWSVWFASPDVGVVGAYRGPDLAITNDGGASWERFDAKGSAEVVTGCGDESQKGATRVRIAGGRVIVKQCGGVFSSPIGGPREWTRVTAGGEPLVDFDVVDDGRVVGVTAGRRVYAGDRFLGIRLEHPPAAIAVRGKRIALIDSTKKVAVFDGNAWHTSRILGKGAATSAPIAALDRGAGDVLWGVSGYFLYRSAGGAKTWDRIAELPVRADRVLIQSDGNLLLSGRNGWVARWDVKANALSEVPVLDGLDIVGAFRREDLWLVYGGRQSEQGGEYGFVAASKNGGRAWKVIDRWKDHGPQALFLSDDDRLTLLSRRGHIRQGRIRRWPLGANMETVFSDPDGRMAAWVSDVRVLDFLGGDEGWLVVWDHWGTSVAHTADGGRSWGDGKDGAYRITRLERLFDGTWIGFGPGPALQRWTGTKFEKLVAIPPDMREAVVDSRGELLLRFEDGTVQVLDAQRGELRALP